MTPKKPRKPGRPPKAIIGPKSHPLTFRVSDDIYRALVKAADAAFPPRSIADEARHRLAQSVEIEHMSGGTFDMGDAMRAARYAAVLQNATVAAGDDSGRWIAYADKLPAMINLDAAADVERVGVLVRTAVDDFLVQATQFLEKHGDPPPEGTYVKLPYGTPQEVISEMNMHNAMHRFYARKRAEILKNRGQSDHRWQIRPLAEDE